MSSICDFGRILKTECNLQHFTRNCRIKNFDDFERDEADAYLWRVALINVKEKGMIIHYIMNWCLVMFLRGGEVNVVQYWWTKTKTLQLAKVFVTCKKLYTAFKEKHANVNIGSSKFCALRPKWCVIAGSKMTHSVCICTAHQNVVLLVDAVHCDLT